MSMVPDITIMFPEAPVISRPAPMAAAVASGQIDFAGARRERTRAPFSTWVISEGIRSRARYQMVAIVPS